MNNEPLHYRYDMINTFNGYKLQECIYYVVKETPKGYWLDVFQTKTRHAGQRWVSKESRKRFAYPSKIEALNSFKLRKIRQIQILNSQLNKAEIGLKIANKILSDDNIDNNIKMHCNKSHVINMFSTLKLS